MHASSAVWLQGISWLLAAQPEGKTACQAIAELVTLKALFNFSACTVECTQDAHESLQGMKQ